MTRNMPVPFVSPEDDAFIKSLIVHQDDDMIAFNKPSGLPVQDGRGIDQSLDSLLAAFARSNGKRPRLVHRLDAGTSGLIIVAKTQPAAAFLSAEFAERRTKKTYIAIVGGAFPRESAGLIDASLMHQIRIHLAHLGCPILGDPIYGSGQQDAPRLMLHALSLEVRRPSGDVLVLNASIPSDFDDVARNLGFKSYSGWM